MINEILFNPLSGGSDFVELYNNSNKLCDLKSLWFINKDDSAAIDNSYQITTISRLLLPEEYCAISKDIAFIENNYHVPFLKIFSKLLIFLLWLINLEIFS